MEKSSATHPIYQFRLFCTLNHIKEHLDHMANNQNKKEGYALKEQRIIPRWMKNCLRRFGNVPVI